jgi:formate dehydrogenase major subunit
MPFAYHEAAANLLTNAALDPFGKIPEFKYCAVGCGTARRFHPEHGRQGQRLHP